MSGASWVMMVILVIVGILCMTRPELMWRLEHYFSVEEGKPKEEYLKWLQFLGLCMIIFVFIFSGISIYQMVTG